MKALLVRVGIDQKFGGWNAPVDADGPVVRVSIPERPDIRFHLGLDRRYNKVLPVLRRFHRTHIGLAPRAWRGTAYEIELSTFIINMVLSYSNVIVFVISYSRTILFAISS